MRKLIKAGERTHLRGLEETEPGTPKKLGIMPISNSQVGGGRDTCNAYSIAIQTQESVSQSQRIIVPRLNKT